jgi:hypothetical protein
MLPIPAEMFAFMLASLIVNLTLMIIGFCTVILQLSPAERFAFIFLSFGMILVYLALMEMLLEVLVWVGAVVL